MHLCRRIDCEQLRSRINQQLIAGSFGHEGLRQLRTKLVPIVCFVCPNITTVRTLYSLLTGMPKLPTIKLLVTLLHTVPAQDHLVFHQHATRHTLYSVWFQNLINGLQTSVINLH